MRMTIKRAVATGVIVTGLALGGTGVAVAATNGAAAPGAASPAEEQDPTFTGSVTAPKDAAEGTDAEGTEQEGADSTTGEADESKALQPLATTTADEAIAAALAAVPGKAGAAQLESENGYVVYDVEVTVADGTTVDVQVDAGNGTVLAQEAGDTETNDG
ncbi:PepSY domain-containing protein [Cryobacterium sp. CG_9.6]|uniref:PepSY domain-containing protein n=1 Tax=Cryobacterium sp. CG_9.6 TaxID=2760710 RepID=UPI0024748154|nr:PepSY domain-containing protein [Cryobacterium sp. CG_9.6]MDH6238534.1 putative membrane protein YkoI [Cryobacterium sp. CG_9.6]